MRVRAPRSEPERRVSHGHAPRLVHLLRTARISLLVGPAGVGKTSLIRNEVLTLLARRAGDAPASRPSARVVVPFVERRERSAGRPAGKGVELPVVFDAWGNEPLAALRRSIDLAAAWVAPELLPAALPGLAIPLAAAGHHHSLRFLIILDGFERHLAQPSPRADIAAFDDALIDALNRPFLPVHFLISIREEAEPALEAYRSRIARFDDHVLRLEGAGVVAASPLLWRGVGPTIVPPSPPPADAPPVADFELPPWPAPLEQSSDGWLASLDNILLEVAEAGRGDAKASVDFALPELSDAVWEQTVFMEEPEPPSGEPSLAEGELAAAPGGAAKPLARRWPPSPILSGAAVLAMLLVLALVWPRPSPTASPTVAQRDDRAEPSPVLPIPAPAPRLAASPRAPAASPVPAPLPRLELAFEAGSSDVRIGEDLSRLVAPAAGLALDPVPANRLRQGLPGVPGGTTLGIARYDALQAAARQRDGAKEAPLRVIAPLVIEPIGFLVRDDSPLRYVHQLKGRRINVGPSDSGRALSAAAVYERAFGGRLPASAVQTTGEEAALRQLQAGTGALDAVATLGRAPEPGSGLRVLQLDSSQASTAKLMQAYLPATLGGTPTLGVMTFLVAPQPADAATRNQLADLAGALCESLPSLQSRGDARWQQLSPGLELDAGWPMLPEAQAAWRKCSPTR